MSELNPSQFIIYQSEDGQTRLDVRFVEETVWLTQALMAELFGTSKQNIGQHLKNIFLEQELTESSVVKDFFTTAADISFDTLSKKVEQISPANKKNRNQ